MILHDPYALHRKWWDWTWQPSIGDESWTDWDYFLSDALQIIEDYTDKDTGQLIWYDQSGDVHWDVGSTFSGSKEALEKEQERRGELKPGESLYAIPVFGAKKPTLSDWIRDMEEDKADRRPSTARDARPPTRAELEALKASREKNSKNGKLD